MITVTVNPLTNLTDKIRKCWFPHNENVCTLVIDSSRNSSTVITSVLDKFH